MDSLQVPGPSLGFLIVTGSVIVAIAGVYIIRRHVHYSILKEDHEVAGYLCSMAGTIYAVLLGFITVVVWQHHRDAQNYVQQEAMRVSNLFRDAQVFPDQLRRELRERLIVYTKAVMIDEWQTMARGKPSPTASEAYEKIWETMYKIQPGTEREKAFYKESITRLNDLSGIRGSRILSSKPKLHSLLWVLLIGGAVIIIIFTYMFGSRNTWSHVLICGLLAGLIGFILFLVMALSYPFSGSLCISNEPFSDMMDLLKNDF